MMKLTYPMTWSRDRTADEWASHHRRIVALLIGLGLLFSYPMGVFVLAVVSGRHAPVAVTPPPIRGSGVVLSMNDAMGAITVQHHGVPGLNIAPGSTSFRADSAVYKRTEIGDRITFSLTPEDGVYTITGAEPSAAPDDVSRQ